MTPAARAQAWSNDYIRNYCDDHGQNQATRDEAHSNLTLMEQIARDIVSLCRSYIVADQIENVAENMIPYFSDGLDRGVISALIGKDIG